MKNRPLKRAVLKQLESIVIAEDTNEAVLKLITELTKHYNNALQCYEEVEKYRRNRVIRILKKLRVIRL